MQRTQSVVSSGGGPKQSSLAVSIKVAAMADEAAVIQANIVRFRALLETCGFEETKRQLIEKLLTEFTHKLLRVQQAEDWPPE